MRPVDVVRKLCPNAKASYVKAFEEGDDKFRKYGITTPLRVAHFMAQCFAETGGLTIEWESGNYSADRLVQIFGPGHHTPPITSDEAARLAHKPEAIFERVYGSGSPQKAKELGNLKPGDAYRLRGGGMLQTTGGDNYTRIGKKLGLDLYNHPELVLDSHYALLPAMVEWDEDGLNAFADRDDVLSVSRAINLGSVHSTRMPNGYNDRTDWLRRIKGLPLTSVELHATPMAPVSPALPPTEPIVYEAAAQPKHKTGAATAAIIAGTATIAAGSTAHAMEPSKFTIAAIVAGVLVLVGVIVAVIKNRG